MKNIARREDDKRTIVDSEKLKRIEYFFENGRTDEEWVRSLKFTNKEKAAILRDPRFLDLFDAKMLDYFLGLEKIDRGVLDLSRLITARLGLLNQSKAKFEVKANKIVIGTHKKGEVIEAEKDD